MNKNIKLCVTLSGEIITNLEYFFDARRNEYFTRSALFDVANILFTSGQTKKIKIAEFIRENIEVLVNKYSKEYQVWEYKALKYADDHRHGISSLIIKDIYCDKIWEKDFSSGK